jgi:predicted kinase
MKQYVFVTVGVPGCGKSRFYHKCANDDDWGMGDVPAYVSSDDIREELFGTAYEQSNSDLVFQTVRERAEEHLRAGHSVYLDATHIRKEWRKYALDLAQKYGAVCVALYFDVPFFTAVRRDHKRDRTVGFKVLFRYMRTLELPTKAEGFNGVFRIDRDAQYVEFE